MPHMSNTVSQFLRRDVNKAFAQVTGDYVDRGTGYGPEVPCIYRFYGPEPYLTSGNFKSCFLLLEMMGCSELTQVHSLRDHMHNMLSDYTEVAKC